MITTPGKNLAEKTRQAIQGGADVIQLRDKNASHEDFIAQAKALLEITRPGGIPLIINDRVFVAKLTGADGVHLGQDDGPLSAARQVLGENAIIGRSTHSLEQALNAEREGFDYIGVGPVFETPTKPGRAAVGMELVTKVSQSAKIPFVAIGGIDEKNIQQVVQAGAKTIAVVRAVMESADPQKAAAALKQKLEDR